MKKANILIFGSAMLATLIGIFGQDISYYLYNSYGIIELKYNLTILSIFAILLYLVALIFTYIYSKQRLLSQFQSRLYFSVIGLIGLFTSVWSLVVLAFWWG